MEKYFRICVLILYLFALPLSVGFLKMPISNQLDWFLWDKYFRWRSESEISKKVVLIGVDEKSIQTFGNWPWPRDIFALFLTKLNKFTNVKVIAIDVFYSHADPSTDFFFIQSLNQLKHDVLPWVFEFNSIDTQPFTLNDQEKNIFQKLSIPAKANFKIQATDLSIKPHIKIYDEISSAGHVNIFLDNDGIIRRVPLAIGFENRVMPHFSLSLYAEFKNTQIESMVESKHHQIWTFKNKEQLKIPVNSNQNMVIPWQSNGSSEFPIVSFLDVFTALEQIENGKSPNLNLNQLFDEKCALIGLTAKGYVDIKPTPLDKNFPMLGIHAHLLQSFLENNFISESPFIIEILIVWLLLLISFPLVILLRKKFYFNGLILFALAWIELSFYSFNYFNILIPTLSPLVLVLIILLCALLLSQTLNIVEIKRLFKQAITDELTGLYTSRFFKFELQKLFKKTTYSKDALSLMILDIDNFKRVNDTYGHEVGNVVLKGIADIMKNICNEYALIPSRYGGEEFCVIMPNVVKEKALKISEIIRTQIEKKAFPTDNIGMFLVTASLGVVTMPLTPCENTRQMIQFADMAMYRSKKTGKNQVNYFSKDYAELIPEAIKTLKFTDEFKDEKLTGSSLDYVSLDLKQRNRELQTIIDQLKKTRDSLVEQEKKAQSFRLVTFLTHELNKPLHNIQSCLDRVSHYSKGQKEIEKFNQLAMDEIKRITQLSRQMVNSNQTARYEDKDFDFNELFKDIAILSEKMLHSQRVELSMKLHPEPCVFYGKIEEFKQVLINLITNAKDAMPNGGDLIIETLRDQESIQIRIKDTGEGIPKEIEKKVFEPFFTTKSKDTGTGLGLVICKQIIEKNNGIFYFESEIGVGTCFIIKLRLDNQSKKGQSLTT